ncbi:hypothetical protein B0H66DRAFT_618924 [Apodospora peruviana]|uniref:MHYT domain-containing protein n=1 Tax=Apodospora peruviana TaxID=516989 RepID=A0AAE0M708_9PEZI|nr:hypothetical protein B0H66DRAFT_618924 [Apodospora peruviana]
MGSSPDVGLAAYVGQDVPFRYNPIIVALSFFVSFVGAESTVELINRRTSRKGRHNHVLLLGAAISMGAIAIWSMHFIGNRATTLLNGEPELQISYSIRMTALSFFVPILVLLVAFYVVTTSITTWWNIGLSGSLSGGAICGMHYLGNASIDNYHCKYSVAHVAGAAVIAAMASTVALALFFVFRAAWANAWWKRVGCAIVLAGAVSGMHWVASLGTSFTLHHINPNTENASSITTVVVVACLSVGACLVMAGMAVYSAHVRKGYANKAQRITLAAAVFDKHGRILVTPDGHLPSEEITRTFLQKATSRNWQSITNLIEKMTDHLAVLSHHGNGRKARLGIELVDDDGHFIENHETIFKELFCLAAAGLADKMDESVEDAGILWDEIFATGGDRARFEPAHIKPTTERLAKSNAFETVTSVPSEDEAEKGLAYRNRDAHRHGSLMFLVRKVESSRAVDRLEALGYCFAELRQVSPIIRSSMQIRSHDLEERLRGMASYTQGTMQDPGVHVGLFAVQPRVDNGLFDIVVKKQARNLLPSVKLSLDKLDTSHHDFLRRFDGQSISSLVHQLRRMGDISDSQQDGKFAALLLDAIKELQVLVTDPIFDNAKLVSKVVQVPCQSSQQQRSSGPKTCSFIAFSTMIPIHSILHAPQCEFTPLQFFKVQQLAYENSPHKAVFARSVHRDVVPILNTLPKKRAGDILSSSSSSTIRPRGKWSSRLHRVKARRPPTTTRPHHHRHDDHQREDSDKLVVSASRDRMGSAASSLTSLPFSQQAGEVSIPSEPKSVNLTLSRPKSLQKGQQQQQQQQPQKSSFGGILVSQEVTVVVDEADETSAISPAREEVDGKVVAAHNNQVEDLDNIELMEVTSARAALVGTGGGMSIAEVRKGDNITTFVDEIFATCIDTPTRRL